MKNAAYDNVNKRFKSACKTVLGDEIGEISNFAAWLSGERRPVFRGKSYLSGKEVVFSFPFPQPDAAFISFSEVDFFKKYGPLAKKDMVSIGSIIEAVDSRIAYCGNVILGNSMYVESSTNIIDCLDVYESEHIAYSKGVGYTCEGSYNESIFGCNGIGNSSFLIRCFGCQKSSRCFELQRSDSCSDCYFSAGLSNCKDCMFCFNLKNRQYSVGNVQLSREEYFKVNDHLLAEALDGLKKTGKLPSLMEIVGSHPADYSLLEKEFAALPREKKADGIELSKVEDVFGSTFKIVLGQEHGKMEGLGKWLTSGITRSEDAKSCASGKMIVVWAYANYMTFLRDRLLTMGEADALGERLAIEKASALGICLKNAGKIISKVAFFSPEWHVGTSKNVIKSPLNINSSNIYKCVLAVESKNSALSYIPRNSENIFGSYLARLSSFAIRCFKSAKLRRCFECDSCRECSDLYFCHNCESCNDCMFCFNVKNLRYAIGNVELPREDYMKIKALVLAEINRELDKNKSVGYSILNLAPLMLKI